MREPQASETERASARANGAKIGGYAGFGFGLLAVVSTASEVETPSVGDAAVMVLIIMIIGYVAGWLLQPLFEKIFSQP